MVPRRVVWLAAVGDGIVERSRSNKTTAYMFVVGRRQLLSSWCVCRVFPENVPCNFSLIMPQIPTQSLYDPGGELLYNLVCMSGDLLL